MLPQLTLQSIAALPAASWASVLSRSNPGRSERSRRNTLLLVVIPRPSPVIWRLPGSSPESGTPMTLRMTSSRSSVEGGRCAARSTMPVEVPPRACQTGISSVPPTKRGSNPSMAGRGRVIPEASDAWPDRRAY